MTQENIDVIPEPAPAQSSSRPQHILIALAIPVLFFASIAPTLAWLDFTGGSENLVVESVLEMHRGGPRLVPTLLGVPRTTKPPLAAWIAAEAVGPDTVVALVNPDSAVRAPAFDQLKWQIRWPALLSACLMLLAAYALAQTLFDHEVGAVAAMVCGSSLFFLRFSRAATTDVQLALWVTVTNLFLALAIVCRRPWFGFSVAGAALGLALMSKGPVALVQTILPFGLYGVWRLWTRPRNTTSPSKQSKGAFFAALVGIIIMLAVSLPWPSIVIARNPHIWSAWFREVTRHGATGLDPDPWYGYVNVIPMMLPWVAWLAAAMWLAGAHLFRAARRRANWFADRNDRTVLTAFLLLAPLLVMSFFQDKPVRYALPMSVPASILIADVIVRYLHERQRADLAAKIIDAVHWLILLVIAIGLPIAGAAFLHRLDGGFWFSWKLAISAALIATAIVIAGYLLYRRWDGAAVATTVVLMLWSQAIFMHGYRYSDEGLSDLKPLAEAVWAKYPTADVYLLSTPEDHHRTRHDLVIYLGRLTGKTSDVASLPPPLRPQVVVLFGEKSRQMRLPPQWQFVAGGKGGKGEWTAFARQ